MVILSQEVKWEAKSGLICPLRQSKEIAEWAAAGTSDAWSGQSTRGHHRSQELA